MKKILIIAFIISVFSLYGCSNSKEDIQKSDLKTKKASIVFATNRTDKANNTLLELSKAFMEEHKDIEVKIEGLNDIEQVLAKKMASAELPDITPVFGSLSPKNFHLYLTPIDDIGFSSDDIYFYDNGIGDDGNLYILNSAIIYNCMIYNKKAFREAGIEKIPQTLNEFYEVCSKLKAANIIPVLTAFKDRWPLDWYVHFAFPFSNTADPDYRNSLKDRNEILVDDNGIYQGFKILRKLYQNGYTEPDIMSATWDKSIKMHASGEGAMFYLGTWHTSQMIDLGTNPQDVGVFPFPGTKALFLEGDWYYGVAKNSEYKEAAKTFLKWLWEDGRYSKAIGVTPPLKNMEYSDPYEKELMSYGLLLLEKNAVDPNVQKIFNEASVDLIEAAQRYVLSENPQIVKSEINRRWQIARENVLAEID